MLDFLCAIKSCMHVHVCCANMWVESKHTRTALGVLSCGCFDICILSCFPIHQKCLVTSYLAFMMMMKTQLEKLVLFFLLLLESVLTNSHKKTWHILGLCWTCNLHQLHPHEHMHSSGKQFQKKNCLLVCMKWSCCIVFNFQQLPALDMLHVASSCVCEKD